MKWLVVDIETNDPYIGRGLGAGWVFKLNNIPNNDFTLLGVAMLDSDYNATYETDINIIKNKVEKADILICHNAQYDIGGLMAYGIDVKGKKILDTMIAAKLFDSSHKEYGLDYLAEYYLKRNKKNTVLTDAVWNAGIYPWLKKELAAKEKAEKKGLVFERERPKENLLSKFCKNNMELVQEKCPEAMAEYAKEDVLLTFELWMYFKKHNIDVEMCFWYSYIVHICIDYRSRGIRVHLPSIKIAVDKINELLHNEYLSIYEMAGEEFNINSNKELPRVFEKLGIPYKVTDKGNPSIAKDFLEELSHPFAQLITTARKLAKIKNDFLEKVFDMQEFTLGIDSKEIYTKEFGRVYPELNIMQAKTGRFSSSCPNIQQIPSRDEIYGPICRSIYIPEEGEDWYSLDFSNQEGRLQVHYASLINAEGADELLLQFNANPEFDMHGEIAKLANIERREAKTINLGISYGMGTIKLANSLKIDEQSAKLLKSKYNNAMPFLKELQDKASLKFKETGIIKTILGRSLKLDLPIYEKGKMITFEYRALNKLIQGSASDQTMMAMRMAYDEGIPVLFCVHDELNMSTSNPHHAVRLKEIMETCINTKVKMFTEIKQGKNWGECK